MRPYAAGTTKVCLSQHSTAPVHLGLPTSHPPARWRVGFHLRHQSRPLRVDGWCLPPPMWVPRLALGLSVPAPAYLTTCDPFPRSHSTTHHVFSLSLWETPLYHGALCLARFAPLTLPPRAPSPRSVLSRRCLLPALECVPLQGRLPPRVFAPSPLECMLPLHLRTGGFIPSPLPDFYYSHPWPVGLTRHCAWRRMERGGVGVGDGFPFTF